MKNQDIETENPDRRAISGRVQRLVRHLIIVREIKRLHPDPRPSFWTVYVGGEPLHEKHDDYEGALEQAERLKKRICELAKGMIESWEDDIKSHNENAARYDKWVAQNKDGDFVLYAKCERINACNIRDRINDVKSLPILSNV